VPEQPKSKDVPRDVDLRDTHLLEEHAQEDLAITVGGLVGTPQLGQIVGEAEDALAIDVVQLQTAALFELLVLALKTFDLGELVVPSSLERACDDAVVGVARVVLTLGAFSLVLSSFDPQLPLLVERGVLFFEDLHDSGGGERLQPDDAQLQALAAKVKGGSTWEVLFPGVAALQITTQGHGPSLDLRITKKEGIPVQVVAEGTPGATVIAIKRVDELAFYNLSSTQLAVHLGITAPRTVALIRFAKIEGDTDAFKLVAIGKSSFKRYSQKALDTLKKVFASADMEAVWRDHRPKAKAS
jgi:hypothetical protein